jgi:RNA polymerase sigma-70 factor (ECF subfamily)
VVVSSLLSFLAAVFSGRGRATVDIDAWYRTYGPMVLRRCRTLLPSEEEATEAMQDTFVQVIRYADRLDGKSPSSLLYRIATNVCFNRIRSRRRRPEDASSDTLAAIASVASPHERSAARDVLDRLFGGEPDSTATIAVMHLLEGHTHEEVADAVGLSVSGVRKRLRKLRGLLDQMEGAAP